MLHSTLPPFSLVNHQCEENINHNVIKIVFYLQNHYSRDQPSTSTVAHNWVFVPEVIQTKDLQIVKQEPWGYPRCEENLPVHFSYEEAQKIMIEPLQFDVSL